MTTHSYVKLTTSLGRNQMPDMGYRKPEMVKYIHTIISLFSLITHPLSGIRFLLSFNEFRSVEYIFTHKQRRYE
jgi:hypothetical protein